MVSAADAHVDPGSAREPVTAPRRLSICYAAPGQNLLPTAGPTRNVLSVAEALSQWADVTVAFRNIIEPVTPGGYRLIAIDPGAAVSPDFKDDTPWVVSAPAHRLLPDAPDLREAACGCPVIGANSGAIPEITAGTAMLFDPHSPEDLARALLSVTQDASIRRDLVDRALVRVRDFTWDRTARETLSVFQELV